jgi:SPP1 family phage portal protein
VNGGAVVNINAPEPFRGHMNGKQLLTYKTALDVKNKDYLRNSAYYEGKNPVILADKSNDQYGNLKASDRRIPLPLAKKLINTMVGFNFANIVYTETGQAINTEQDFSNLTKLMNTKIDIEEQTDYFKYLSAVNEQNDNDILTLQTAIECCNHGRAYKIYYFAENRLKCDTIPSNQIYPIYTDTLNPALDKALRYYSDKYIDEQGKEKERYYVDIYSKTGIESYVARERDYSDAKLDEAKSVYYGKGNTLPLKCHVIEFSIYRDKASLISSSYGMIDEADRVMSKNMAQELAEFAMSILKTSFVLDESYRDLETNKTMMDKFKESRILQNFSKDSDYAEWLVKVVQDPFIFGVYDRLTKDIFKFEDIPDFSDGESWGNTISGVSAAYRLLGFLFKCEHTFRIFSEGLRAEIELINAYVPLLAGNESVKKTMNVIYISSNRILPKNLLENAQIAGMLKGILSQKTLIQMFPELVDNADDELKAVNGEAKEAVKNLMMSVEEPQEEDDGMQTGQEETEEEVE